MVIHWQTFTAGVIVGVALSYLGYRTARWFFTGRF